MSSDEADGSQLNWDGRCPSLQQEGAPSGSKAFCTVAKETRVGVWVCGWGDGGSAVSI